MLWEVYRHFFVGQSSAHDFYAVYRLFIRAYLRTFHSTFVIPTSPRWIISKSRVKTSRFCENDSVICFYCKDSLRSFRISSNSAKISANPNHIFDYFYCASMDAVTFYSREDLETMAATVLRNHGLYSIPVNPVILANKEGIKVHNAQFSDETLSGLLAKRQGNTTILVNSEDTPFRKRFTIAHELAHYFLHLKDTDGEMVDHRIDFYRNESNNTVSSDNQKKEVQANIFAAALLMPKDLILDAMSRYGKSLEKLAKIFNVSEEAMGIRLNVLKLI